MASIIDADVHCAVPSPDALFPYMPEQWQEHHRISRTPRSPAVAMAYPAWAPGLATDGKAITLESLRHAVLERAELAVLYCYHGVESYTHPYLAQVMARAVNQWLAREWLDEEPRLLGTAVVTPQYLAGAVEELERIADDPRFVQILLPARSRAGYGNQGFWPLLEAADRNGLAVAISYGGGTGMPQTPVNWLGSFFEEYVAATLTFQSHIMSLVMSGIFQRCPGLRIVIAESGLTWLPSLMWRMDQEWKACWREVPWVQERPSAYVRRHFRFTTAPVDAPAEAGLLAHSLEQIGGDGELLMYASDHPHRYAQNGLLELLSDEQSEQVLWRNAVDTYRLEQRSLLPAR
jgi:predicted TIM-barrel fold metal-dependent hydrolase